MSCKSDYKSEFKFRESNSEKKGKLKRKIPDDEFQNWLALDNYESFNATRIEVRAHVKILEQIGGLSKRIISIDSNTVFAPKGHPTNFDGVEELDPNYHTSTIIPYKRHPTAFDKVEEETPQ